MKYLNIQELSSHLNVKAKTIYGWISQREIPHFKLGRLVRFEKDEIDRWLEQKKVDPIDLEKLSRKF
ncbi:MAG: helix-turn-helix domain-containing protein [Nitrospirae bacterium]|nr:helix-turn-helix domain-containing protein [Nitrospirota bacterium]